MKMKSTKQHLRTGLLTTSLLALLIFAVTGCTTNSAPVAGVGSKIIKPAVIITDKSDPYLVVVNARHPMQADQQPDLKTVQGSFQMEVKAADAFVKMISEAKQQGIKLQVVSAYRSQAKQRQLYNAKVQVFLNKGYAQADAEAKAATIVARPGTSEHNTGLAVDVITPSYTSLNLGFAATPAAKWLVANSARYGFILRYPDGKQSITGVVFEPWHFRYVGPANAQTITRDSLCLEQFVGN